MGERKLTILACVGPYPSPYKPYFDAQFADFLSKGHDLHIMAVPPLDAGTNGKVEAHRLTDRTHSYILDGRLFQLGLRGLTRPVACARFALQAPASGIRRKMADMMRMLTLPELRPDVVLVHGLGVALSFQWLQHWFGVPVGLYYHGGEVPSVKRNDDAEVARAFSAFSRVFTNTQFSAQHAIARGCPPEKLRVLPVGFDLRDFTRGEPRCYRPGGTLRLISAGRMSEEKGLEYALEALDILVRSGRSDVVYSIAGDGYLRPKLEALVKSARLESHVRFLGTLASEEVISQMECADALVLSSVTVGNCAETQACAVQEAMLKQAVVITTETGGVQECIPPEMKRFSVPERDAPALAKMLMDVYDMPVNEFANLGRIGRDFAATHYDMVRLNDRILEELRN